MTQKPLKDMLPEIFEHIEKYRDYSEFNLRVYRVNEGQVKREVIDSLSREILSPSALARSCERIPGINIMAQATDKLSKVYTASPNRQADKPQDQDIMDNIVKWGDIDAALHDSNRMLNAQFMSAVGPFIQDGKVKFRVLGAHQFLPFSDDPVNPLTMTVFIAFAGRTTETINAVYDINGKLIEEAKTREIDLFALYSDEEFMIVDSGHRIRFDLMQKWGITTTVNELGVIPYCLITNTQLQLVPFTNQQGFDTAILIPKLFTDLNYSAQFQSHSIIYSKNTNLEGASINPDAIVHLGDKTIDGGDPEIGVIDPKTDIDGILKLIKQESLAYFTGLGMKVNMEGVSDESGFAKAVDESDVTDKTKKQTELYAKVELKLWNIVQQLHNSMASKGALVDNRKLSKNFSDEISITFAERKVMKTEKQLLDEIEIMRNLKLMSRRQALRLKFPQMTEAQIDNWEKELDEEKEQAMEDMLGSPFGETMSGQGSDGKFTDGNQAGLGQNESEIDRES